MVSETGFPTTMERLEEQLRTLNNKISEQAQATAIQTKLMQSQMQNAQAYHEKQIESFHYEDSLFRIERKNALERIRNSAISLAQLILERKGVPNASFVASQLFEEISENKEEEILQKQEQKQEKTLQNPQLFDEIPQKKIERAEFKLQGKAEDEFEGELEQPSQSKQSPIIIINQGQLEALKLQTEEVNTSTTDPHYLPCFITELETKISSTKRSYHPTKLQSALGQTKDAMEELQPKPPFKSPVTTPPWTQDSLNNLKPNPTFRSPLPTIPCTQTTPNKLKIMPETDLSRQGNCIVAFIKRVDEDKHLALSHQMCKDENYKQALEYSNVVYADLSNLQAVAFRDKLAVDDFQGREKKTLLVVVYAVLVLNVAAMENLGKFQSVWQVQFTAFIHSWGQECSEGEGIVTTMKGMYGT